MKSFKTAGDCPDFAQSAEQNGTVPFGSLTQSMPWPHILEIDPGPHVPLRERIDALFAQQRATWPMLRNGEAALAQLQKKTLTDPDGSSIVVQVNPARRQSTTAKTDAKSLAARPCFLCPENMPPEERGIAFEDLVLLPNPFPILPLHCTIPSRVHEPQKLAGRIGTFLRLAQAVGPDMAALYNGPQCGASAPDHFHFQAAASSDIPLLSQLPPDVTRSSFVAHSAFGRNMLLFAGASAEAVQGNLERALNALTELASPESGNEPMLNLLAQYKSGRYLAVLFPRAAHRPACYFATGTEQLTISPAVLEMAGVLVTTDVNHFQRVDTATAHGIFEEVSYSPARFKQLVARLAG